jgi:hypothetical protein
MKDEAAEPEGFALREGSAASIGSARLLKTVVATKRRIVTSLFSRAHFS